MKFKTMLSKTGMNIKKYSPELLLGVGIVGFVGTVVLAYKAEPAVERVIEDIEAKREDGVEVNKMEVAKDLGKVLALPITVGVLSVGAIVWSHKIQMTRIKALAGFLSSAQTYQKMFEDKVKREFGNEAFDKMVSTDYKETISKDDDGKEKVTVKELKSDLDDSIAQWYDTSSEYFSDDHGYNMAFIDEAESKLDLKKFSKGSLLLNEVLDLLGFDRLRNGALLGWTDSDYFAINKIVIDDTDPVTGEFKKNILVKWTTPRYIYNDIDFQQSLDTF